MVANFLGVYKARMMDRDAYIRSTAFERSDHGFVYYQNAWTKGVQVTAGERDLYLYGASSDWWNAIIDREATVPRRPYWRTLRRIFTALLAGFDPEEPNV